MENADLEAKLHRYETVMNEIIDLVWEKVVREQSDRHSLGISDADPVQYQYHHGIVFAAFRGLGMETGISGSDRA